MKVDIYSIQGKVTGSLDLRDDVFDVPFNEAVVHQALVRHLANRRQGTADTQTRGEVTKSTRKLYMQKHTGRARAGSMKSPLRKGGGVVFGPHPRSYRQDMPKKMRRLAIRCVLSEKARSGALKVIEDGDLGQPKTKAVYDMLVALEIGSSVLIATTEDQKNLVLSASNIEGVSTTPARLLNVADMLASKALVLSASSVAAVEELWGSSKAQKAQAGK